MPDIFTISKTAVEQWSLVNNTTSAFVGEYSTAAEALDVSGGTLGSDVFLTFPSSGDAPSLALDPIAPVGWESCGMLPAGISYPEISNSELVRSMAGINFGGFQITFTLAPVIGLTYPDGRGVSSSGTYVGQGIVSNLLSATAFFARNAQTQALGSPLINLIVEGAAAVTVSSNATLTATAPTATGNPPEITTDYVGGGISSDVSFYRGETDKSAHMRLLIDCTGGGTAAIYDGAGTPFSASMGGARISIYTDPTGVSIATEYGLSLPADTSTETYTAITGSGPTILGVATKLFGYTYTRTVSGASGSIVWTPSVTYAEYMP